MKSMLMQGGRSAGGAGGGGSAIAGSSVTKIVTDAAYEADVTVLTVPAWRDYDQLLFVLKNNDGSERYIFNIWPAQLSQDLVATFPLEQNNEGEATATAGSDDISVDCETAGSLTGFPDAGDTADVWGFKGSPGGNAGVGPEGPTGPGATPGWIEPKDEYDADDLHKFVIENGIVKHIVLEAHAGHSRVVEFQTLANAVSMLGADGNSVASDFLGFFPNVSGIPSGVIADEKWAAIIGAGDFEIQDPTSFYASERWYSYNPFRGAGYRPWSTITLADATTQDHVPFIDPDTGIVSDWRIVNITEHAERFTTAVGEAFFIQDEQKIKMVTAYTAAS